MNDTQSKRNTLSPSVLSVSMPDAAKHRKNIGNMRGDIRTEATHLPIESFAAMKAEKKRKFVPMPR